MLHDNHGRGVEGSATARYFGGMRALLDPAWQFNARNRRPPTDPVNVALSLGCTLLMHKLVGKVTYLHCNAAVQGRYSNNVDPREGIATHVPAQEAQEHELEEHRRSEFMGLLIIGILFILVVVWLQNKDGETPGTAPAQRQRRPQRTSPAMESVIDLLIERNGIDPFVILSGAHWDTRLMESAYPDIYIELNRYGLLPLDTLTQRYIEGRVLVLT